MIKPGGMGYYYYSLLMNFPITKNTIIIDPKEEIQIKKKR